MTEANPRAAWLVGLVAPLLTSTLAAAAPTAAARHDPATRTPSQPEAPPDPTADPLREDEDAQAKRDRPRAIVRATGAAGFSSAPRAAGAFEGTLGLQTGARRLEVTLGVWPAIPLRHPADDDLRVGLRLVTGAARGCWVPTRGERVSVPVCGGIEGGAWRARGRGGTNVVMPDRVPWLAGVADVGVTVHLRERLGLFAGGGVAVAFLRSRLRIAEHPAPVLHAPAVIARIRFGLELRFGGPTRGTPALLERRRAPRRAAARAPTAPPGAPGPRSGA